MKTLEGISVLCAGLAAADQQVLGVWLTSEGASLHHSSWDTLASELQRVGPAVVLADLRAAPDRADAPLQQPVASGGKVPVVALIERGPSGSAFASQGQWNKYITMPCHPADVVHAITSLAKMAAPSRRPSTLESSLSELLEGCAERNDMRAFLSLVNATGPFRFTSILRFDEDERLTSVWTFDRENQTADTFPVDATTPSSYCVLVRDRASTFAMPDAAQEPAVENHPKRYSVLSYCGVPLYDGEAEMVGTLCSYDVAPRFFAANTVSRLEETALILSKHSRVLTR